MSKEELQTIAQKDTPEQINVPSNLQGLIVWAIGRFGLGVVLAIIMTYAANMFYQDSRVDRAQLLTAYEKSTSALVAVTKTLEDVSKQVETNTRAVENLTRK